MHFDLTDLYRSRPSAVHRLDPRVKVTGAVLYIVAAGLVPVGAWMAFGLLFVLSLLASTAARLGTAFALRRSYIALPFALVALPLLFTVPGETLVTLPMAGSISIPGAERFASLLLRSWVAVQGAILLTAATPFPDILWALGALRMPAVLVATIGFMYRYIFVLADETARMLRARAARSAAAPGGRRPTLVWRARVAGLMVGSLFLRALERSERVHAAMLARGFRGAMPAAAPRAMRLDDWVTAAAVALVLAGLLAWTYAG